MPCSWGWPTVITLVSVGFVWAFRANGSDRTIGVPLHEAFVILVFALAAGALVQRIARGYATTLLSSAWRVATFGLIGTILVASVFPAQVFIEAREQFGQRESERVESLKPVDVDAMQIDPAIDLRNALALRFSRSGAQSTTPPNVLVITVDALRADHIGACGNDWIQTPWIDLLAQNSAISCNAYTQQPQTNPALASLMTSTYPAVNGVRRHMVDRLSDSFDTLAKELKRSG